MSDKHYVITIERQYGSGGRITGMRLAEELGIHYYDEEILKMTSETSAIGEQYFRLADEKAGNNLLYRTVTNMKPELSAPVKDGHRLTSPENLFRFQSEVIRKLAARHMTMLLTTHEMGFARSVADRVIFLADGKVQEQGTPQ